MLVGAQINAATLENSFEDLQKVGNTLFLQIFPKILAQLVHHYSIHNSQEIKIA